MIHGVTRQQDEQDVLKEPPAHRPSRTTTNLWYSLPLAATFLVSVQVSIMCWQQYRSKIAADYYDHTLYLTTRCPQPDTGLS